MFSLSFAIEHHLESQLDLFLSEVPMLQVLIDQGGEGWTQVDACGAPSDDQGLQCCDPSPVFPEGFECGQLCLCLL